MLKQVKRVVGVIPAAAVLGPAATGNARAPSTFESLAARQDGARLESVVPVLRMAFVAVAVVLIVRCLSRGTSL